MTYLGIDLWNKRVWIATSSENIAFPKAIVQRTHIISYLKKLFIELPECRDVVIGLPYDLYGIDSRQLDRTHKFIDKLKEIFPNKIIHWHDERFTSFQAWEGWFSDHRDDIAAQCILQSFLDTKR
jgi:RNase H-fold protein (predicted Holliday junction resolvase)